MNKSETITEIAKALNSAQAEMSGAKKKAANPFFKSTYADLGSVVDAIRIPFAENGLSYSQFPIFDEGRVGVETILMHSSGEWLSDRLLLPMTKQDPQAAGSAITYARRYALQAIAGIPSEDDDGNSATHNQKPEETYSRHLALGKAVQEHWESVTAIKQYLAEGEFGLAAEAYAEIPENDRMALSMARTKGGIWTKEEVDLLKSDEWSQARAALYKD